MTIEKALEIGVILTIEEYEKVLELQKYKNVFNRDFKPFMEKNYPNSSSLDGKQVYDVFKQFVDYAGVDYNRIQAGVFVKKVKKMYPDIITTNFNNSNQYARKYFKRMGVGK